MLAESLGETVFLVVHRRGALRVFDRVEGAGFLRVSPAIGDEIPAGPTAAGAIQRAFGAGREGVEGFVEGGSGQALGHAVNRDAWIAGLSVLAVPIVTRRGAEVSRGSEGGSEGASDVALAGVLAVGAPSARFDRLGEAEVAARLVDASRDVTRRLEDGRPVREATRRLEDGRQEPDTKRLDKSEGAGEGEQHGGS